LNGYFALAVPAAHSIFFDAATLSSQ